jgi:hypothetical protein
MWKQPKRWALLLIVLAVAAAYRVSVAHFFPNDAPDDGRIYSQIARDVLEQHSYSSATESPYDPTLIRLPGYPLFLAAIYVVFGHTNNGAVRIVQALVDTGTCVLAALLAFYWQPDEKRKRATAMVALVLAAVCPFTTIYAATILCEVPATLLGVATCLAATLAFQATEFKRSLIWWCVAGLLAGISVEFRPDEGLFAAAIGVALVITSSWRFWNKRRGQNADEAGGPLEPSQATVRSGRASRLAPRVLTWFRRPVAAGALFSLAFVLILTPWTIRNARVFHLFQPLAPTHGNMPDEFVPLGYTRWLMTWLDDQRYVDAFWWEVDVDPIDVDKLPAQAFDSAQERDRVAALLDQYNHPPDKPADETQKPETPAAELKPSPSPGVTESGPKRSNTAPAQPSPDDAKAKPSTNAKDNPSNDNADSDQADNDDSDQGNDSDSGDDSPEAQPEEHGSVEMTPDIDTAFAQIARERIARHPLRYHLWLPARRAYTMWFDTHSQYWPFEGYLFPLDDLDYDLHQQIWLPLFTGLMWMYTLLGLAGGWLLWRSRSFAARRVLLLVGLLVFLRLAFFASFGSPEPRYLVEFFPFLAALGGISIAGVLDRLRPGAENPSPH